MEKITKKMKMKYFLLVVLIIMSLNGFAQVSEYPEGMYMSFKEVIDKQPSEHYNVELEERSEGKIKMNGGNDYELNAIEKSVKNSVLRKDVIAYSSGEDLYLNCIVYQLQPWYAKVVSENEENFVFKAALPMFPKKYDLKQSELPNMFCGLIGGVSAMKLALLRFPYVMNKSTQEITLVTQKNINEVLKGNDELLNRYNQETEKDEVETIMKYLLEWSEGLKS